MEKKADRCLFCETELDEKDEYCPYCGIEVRPKQNNNGGGKNALEHSR